MAQVQISISNTTGGSSSANGTVTDPATLAKVREILDTLTDSAAVTDTE
ncbi:hypothetical protein [Arthrobacter glacialis]|nr:hypothetical protein [Arthrobacter glacialis]